MCIVPIQSEWSEYGAVLILGNVKSQQRKNVILIKYQSAQPCFHTCFCDQFDTSWHNNKFNYLHFALNGNAKSQLIAVWPL